MEKFMNLTKKFKPYFYLASLCTSLLSVFGCNSCVDEQYKKYGFERYRNGFSKAEKLEKGLIDYITKRTVRIAVNCKVVDNTTRKVVEKYKENGWGTGTILVSTKDYSLIQTALHITAKKNKKVTEGTRICDKLYIEQVNTENRSISMYKGKVEILKINKKIDVAILKVFKNYRVSTPIAKDTYLGQGVRVLGYQWLRGVKSYHLSYEKGYIATHNIGLKNVKIKGALRIGVAGYFGNSGGAVWNQQGELVGIITSLIGFGTLGGYVPQQNCLYGPGIEALRPFYKRHKDLSIILME
jgi:hypothetical protein